MWEKRIAHHGLNAFRVIKGQTQSDVEMKTAAQEATWAAMWQRRQEAEAKKHARALRLEERDLGKYQIEDAKRFAMDQTRELETERDDLASLLRNSLDKPSLLDWEKQKDQSKFETKKPALLLATPLPDPPSPTHPFFTPQMVTPSLSLFDKLIPSRRTLKISSAEEENLRAQHAANERFQAATKEWTDLCQKITNENDQSLAQHEEDVRNWKAEREQFLDSQRKQHQHIDEMHSRYILGEKYAIEFHTEELLNISEYPEGFPQERAVEYQNQTKTLVIDFELPDLAALPKIREVRYVASRSAFQETPASEVWLKKTYEEVLYQLALRTVNEVFLADEINALISVVFNGWVRSIDKSTGAETHACIMSLEAGKDEFLAITLEHVDPKACFKKLKGVSASKLAELSPVKPIVMLNKEDHRFIEGYAVADSLDERTNLAAMDWQDFENLIREVFEKEFRKDGGEVKITQTSRDGGVDAIAFDPDPIRGGKIVIQAKRYTNTVGVSAVRDLFGTVHNEGANKGILVTTSDFGPDAYSFSKDKPITLISGAELLYLLSRHGHSAKIDLAEAKKLMLG